MPSDTENVLKTYHGLRLAMVLLVVLLFVAVGIQIVGTAVAGEPCLQPSLSAYYYTPVRPVFIASLCAVGVCLIVYRGSLDLENVLLDVSGFLAVIVAFVPTRMGAHACDTSNVPSAADVTVAETNNLSALFAVGLLAFALSRYLNRRWFGGATVPGDPAAKRGYALSLTALLAGFAFFVVRPDLFVEYGHATSACALFAGVLAVVVINARAVRSPVYRSIYSAVAASMVVLAGGIFLFSYVVGGFEHHVFWVETVLITGFAVFWGVQTYELRRLGARPPEMAQPTAKA